MALPSKKQFTNFLVQFWHLVTQNPVLNHPKLSTLHNAMLESITEDEELNGQKIAAFFEEKAYLNKQRELHALATQATGQNEAKMLHSLQRALEQLRVAFTALKNPLPLESVERVLPFDKDNFKMKGDQLWEICLTVNDIQQQKESSALKFTGVKKGTDGVGQISFLAAPGTAPEVLFYRAFLELDPAFLVEFSGGTEHECETLALLCMANNIRWTSPSHPLKEANRLEAALSKLSKRMNTSDPAEVYQALDDPTLQHYYKTTCLATDKRRGEELEEKAASAGRRQRPARTSFGSSSSSSSSSTQESEAHFSQRWQQRRPRPKEHEPVIEVLDEEEAERLGL